MRRQLSPKRVSYVADAKFQNLAVRVGRFESYGVGALVTLIALAVLQVLAIVAYRGAPWFVPVGAVVVGLTAILIAWRSNGSFRSHREEGPPDARNRRKREDPPA